MGKKAFMFKRELLSSSLNLDLTENNYQMLCMECGTLCSRDLDSDKSRQETVRSLRSLNLGKNAKDQLKGQSNKFACSRKSKGRKLLNTIWQRKHTWLGHLFRNDVLLQEISEGRMKGKALRGRKRLHMMSDLSSSAKYADAKRAAEDREGWRAINRRGMA